HAPRGGLLRGARRERRRRRLSARQRQQHRPAGAPARGQRRDPAGRRQDGLLHGLKRKRGPKKGSGPFFLRHRRPYPAAPARKRALTPFLEDAVAVGVGDEVLELRELAEEGQVKLADRPVALLGDDDVRDALPGRIRLVDLFAIDEDDEVRILFYCATFTKIRHHRLLVRPLLDAAVQLRQRDDRHVELLGERLQRA